MELTRDYRWDHISLTGPGAGLTACGKTFAEVGDDTHAHIPYSFSDKDIRASYRCPACVAAWFAE